VEAGPLGVDGMKDERRSVIREGLRVGREAAATRGGMARRRERE
jgi:hypothetical protein